MNPLKGSIGSLVKAQGAPSGNFHKSNFCSFYPYRDHREDRKQCLRDIWGRTSDKELSWLAPTSSCLGWHQPQPRAAWGLVGSGLYSFKLR